MDVYLNTKRDLLVVKTGYPMPPAAAQGKWRKSKKRVIKVSDEISSALQRQGYYMRKLRDLHSKRLAQERSFAAAFDVQSLQHHHQSRSHPRALPGNEPLGNPSPLRASSPTITRRSFVPNAS